MTFVTAPTKTIKVFTRRLAELMVMFTSEKFSSSMNTLDRSVSHQEKAMGNIAAWLKESGIRVPKGVSFSMKPGQIQMTIKISITDLGRESRQR